MYVSCGCLPKSRVITHRYDFAGGCSGGGGCGGDGSGCGAILD